ncbi:DNA cytosine methyltransferase [Phenylobacterium sp.]|uniref:DNA cytosine methyltransferase n=1 Tax=Phenylobacterium sp. TaxID=1871053 RepID=UPI002F953877
MARPRFIDLFSGCGGLALGLMQAGWEGVACIEREAFAFASLARNMVDAGKGWDLEWPEGLPVEPMSIGDFLERNPKVVKALAGTIDLLSGAPPCQGFSSAGRRVASDPRNNAFWSFMDAVRAIQPKMVLIENVKGIELPFLKKGGGFNLPSHVKVSGEANTFSEVISSALSDAGYVCTKRVEFSSDYGVPQLRPRFLLLGIRADLLPEGGLFDFWAAVVQQQRRTRENYGLPVDRAVSAEEAISDLELIGAEMVPCPETKGFLQPVYRKPATSYQRLMRRMMVDGEQPNSMRIPNHRDETVTKFSRAIAWAQETGRTGMNLPEDLKAELGFKKQCVRVLGAGKPAPTVTSIPDDVIHYSEPRVLSVRECARLQSFPDLFEFAGKFTTGGELRKVENPRYTQVGNATPPLLAEVLGHVLARVARELARAQKERAA